MNKPMTKQEWLSYIEQTWDAAQKEAWGEQPRQWVGLTDEERIMCRSYDPEEAVAKTEAKLKEKNQ